MSDQDVDLTPKERNAEGEAVCPNCGSEEWFHHWGNWTWPECMYCGECGHVE